MKKIGKYEIVEKIGVGGFGEVYKAKDPFIKRWVAVKTCTSEDEETRNRFFQEAEIVGRLSHRNVTTVYDFGLEDGYPYLIQEYLSGEDLDRKIKRRDYLPYAEKLHHLIQIARGLAYAHQQGVIHRDIKPSNIRVLEDGTVKIMDFGIAKLAQRETSMTKTGMTVGTAAYLAPEQIRGEATGLFTDVFSFGVLAYELLSFDRPFLGEQISAVIYQILNREPRPIRETWPTAPPEVTELVARCLAKEPQDRLPDAAAVLRFLEHMQETRRGGDNATPSAQVASPAPMAPSMPNPAPIPQPTPAQPAAPNPASRQRSLDDLELTSVSLDESTRSQVIPIRGAATARPSQAPYIGLGLLAILALVAGWGLGDAGRRGQVMATVGSWFGGEATTQPTDGQGNNPSDANQGNAAAGSDRDAGTNTKTPPPPPPPPPPPEPERGRLVVAKVGWTESMTVRVGTNGRSYPLSKVLNFPLPAGTYQITFEVNEPDFRSSAEVRVTLREGERTDLKTPILQPGALTVRAALGTPQARILLDEEELGSSPIRRKKSTPNEYRLSILPLSGEAEGLEESVRVDSGQETVFTFDLDTGNVAVTVKALAKPASTASEG